MEFSSQIHLHSTLQNPRRLGLKYGFYKICCISTILQLNMQQKCFWEEQHILSFLTHKNTLLHQFSCFVPDLQPSLHICHLFPGLLMTYLIFRHRLERWWCDCLLRTYSTFCHRLKRWPCDCICLFMTYSIFRHRLEQWRCGRCWRLSCSLRLCTSKWVWLRWVRDRRLIRRLLSQWVTAEIHGLRGRTCANGKDLR